jgi:hypothetical protein
VSTLGAIATVRGESTVKGYGTPLPETPRQARRWEVVKNRALEFGLCARCASQFSWGIQNGFSTIHPPCRRCLPKLALLPELAAAGWRRPLGNASRPWLRGDLATASAQTGSSMPPTPHTGIETGIVEASHPQCHSGARGGLA